jgi:hypothetical protein
MKLEEAADKLNKLLVKKEKQFDVSQFKKLQVCQ